VKSDAGASHTSRVRQFEKRCEVVNQATGTHATEKSADRPVITITAAPTGRIFCGGGQPSAVHVERASPAMDAGRGGSGRATANPPAEQPGYDLKNRRTCGGHMMHTVGNEPANAAGYRSQTMFHIVITQCALRTRSKAPCKRSHVANRGAVERMENPELSL